MWEKLPVRQRLVLVVVALVLVVVVVVTRDVPYGHASRYKCPYQVPVTRVIRWSYRNL